MRLILFASYHDNPVHRQNLFTRLQKLHLEGEMPKFIAVEGNRALFQTVIKFQRGIFIREAQDDDILKDLHIKYLRELSDAIAFEADTHSKVFHDFKDIIWLDDVRPDFSTCNDPCCMAERYLDTCRCAIVESKLNITPALRKYELFNVIDKYISSIPDTQTPLYNKFVKNSKFERDKAWGKMLDLYLSQYGETDYGIVIVGENHTKNEPDYLRYLLSNKGHNCEVEFLSKKPQPSH